MATKKSILKRENGSIVLEAALILPFIIIFILVLTSFIRIAVVEMELENAGSETVKQVAHHIYPAIIVYNNLNEQTDTANKESKELSELFDQVNFLSFVADHTKTNILRSIFEPLLDANTNDKIINLKNYQLVNVGLPAALGGVGDNFLLELRYDLALNVPFLKHSITIIKESEERIWYDSSLPIEKANETVTDSEEDSEKDEEKLLLRIHSISSPIQRGHKIKILIEGTRDKEVRIRLTYNSGFVKEVNGKINNKGFLTKEIIIGGHSNEGEYVATVYLDNLAESTNFKVLSKANMDKYIDDRKVKAGK
jgi:hypothetical protein